MTGRKRRTTERLQADAERRLELANELPRKVEQARGWAANTEGSVRVTVNVHGGLTDLELTQQALAADPRRLGAEIVRLARQATDAALAYGIGEMEPVVGDGGTAELAETVGMGDRLEPDAPVRPYRPGVDPNAHRWTVIEQPDAEARRRGRTVEHNDEDDLSDVDFTRYRSDRQ